MSKLEIEIPTDWTDVTLGQYVNIAKIKREEGKAAELNYLIELILILCPTLTRDILEDISTEDLGKIIGDWTWLSKLPRNDKIKKEYIIDKDKYVYAKETDKLTVGEMVTYETLVESEQMTQNDTLSLVLAIILRKEVDGVVEDFNTDEIYNRMRLFENNISIGDAIGLIFFFSTGGKTSTSYLEDCLNQMEELKKTM